MSFKLHFNQLFLSEQLFLPPHTVVSLKAMEILCYFSVCTIKVHGFIGFFFFFCLSGCTVPGTASETVELESLGQNFTPM